MDGKAAVDQRWAMARPFRTAHSDLERARGRGKEGYWVLHLKNWQIVVVASNCLFIKAPHEDHLEDGKQQEARDEHLMRSFDIQDVL